MTNIYGQMVYSDSHGDEDPGAYSREISIADLNLSKGVYFVEMIVNDQRFISKLILSEK